MGRFEASTPQWTPSFGHPKGAQDGAKVGVKIEDKNEDETKKLLKIVLESSWSDPRSIGGCLQEPKMPDAWENVAFHERPCFCKTKVSRVDVGQSWADLSAQKAPKWISKHSSDAYFFLKKSEMRFDCPSTGNCLEIDLDEFSAWGVPFLTILNNFDRF